MRRAIVAALLIGWYFATPGGAVGPFDNEGKCNEVRAEFKLTGTTKCWYYGGEGDQVIYVKEGPRVAVVLPSIGPLATYLSFEMSIEGLKAPAGSFTARVSGSDSLARGVNRTVAHLLGEPEGVRPEKFFFVDADHEMDDDALLKLLAHEVDVVMALTVRKQPPFNLMAFTGQRQMWDEPSKRVRQEFKNLKWTEAAAARGLVQVEAVGRGGLLVDAGVFRALPRPWFQVGQVDPEEFMEDMYFSQLCREAGVGLYVDVGTGEPGPVGTGHTSPVSAFPYRYPDGSMGVELKWPSGKTIVFHTTQPVSPAAHQVEAVSEPPAEGDGQC